MNPVPPDQSLILWLIGVFLAALSGVVGFIFRSLGNTRTETKEIAESVRAELLRAQEASDKQLAAMQAASEQALAVMRIEFATRWTENRQDRDAMRAEIRENHNADIAQHQHLIEAIGSLPMRVADMLRHKDDR